jgi:predicted Rossmann fold nucleotide-binding protein DprA/Smf involved in DNA uptake
LLGDEPVAVDAMVERSRLSSGQVSAGLMALELRGLVRRIAGQRYVRS